MTNYVLDIQFDQQGLQTIAGAGMSVALLQPETHATYQIVALLSTATNNMQIAWTEALSVYTSGHGLGAYSVLTINSFAAAISGQTFTYDGSLIKATGNTTLPQTVQLTNKSGATTVSGLARSFKVNGISQALAITSASSILNNGLGSFTINNQVLLTVLSGAQVGMAVPNQVLPNLSVASKRSRSFSQISGQPPLLLDFSVTTSQTVHFDDQSAQFQTGPLT
ncbi:hypothetical protein E2A64_03410 [Pseudohoeflea suaedae]|uniref:Uncharacterized protein n=1 Tax=Pseudohoeflea suaedae TaxID=877384 RepID=A0A4R5PMG5_9HYPH|nr:hypothetical protein [Pseudohoeflea suaedae]TDH38182.1 hypothetical protein E2A64_03410 [Pseudohoeflea suaedae]